MRRTRLFVQTLSLSIGTGYVLFFFSERVFWSLWRPSDDVGDSFATWLGYSFFAYTLMATIKIFSARSGLALFLAGALFGWICEGIYAMTVFGAGGIPFPVTLAWTGLAWHALLTVLIGWYALRRALSAHTMYPSLGLSAAVGLFWGFWAAGWAGESPPLIAEPEMFFAHAALTTVGLALSEWLIDWGNPAGFHPSRFGLTVACGLIVAFFALVTVPNVPWAPAVIVPLFVLVLLALWRGASPGVASDALARIGEPVRAHNLAGLVVIPFTATGAYVALQDLGIDLPSHQIVFLVTSSTGTVLFVTAIFCLLRKGDPGTEQLPAIIGELDGRHPLRAGFASDPDVAGVQRHANLGHVHRYYGPR